MAVVCVQGIGVVATMDVQLDERGKTKNQTQSEITDQRKQHRTPMHCTRLRWQGELYYSIPQQHWIKILARMSFALPHLLQYPRALVSHIQDDSDIPDLISRESLLRHYMVY